MNAEKKERKEMKMLVCLGVALTLATCGVCGTDAGKPAPRPLSVTPEGEPPADGETPAFDPGLISV